MATTLRLPRIDLSQILQDPNPHIDLRTEVYEESTTNFLKAVVSYKNRAIATISDRRQYQIAEKKRITEKSQLVEAETNQCKLKEIDLVANLEREKEERKDAELAVAALKRQLGGLKDKCAAIQGEIEQYRVITANLRREKDKERATLSTHVSHVAPELIACQQRLACHIEGVGEDKLLLRFNNINPTDPTREASFVFDVSDSYKVLTVSPNLPQLSVLLSQLSETGDIYRFIKDVRKVFRNHVMPSPV